MEKALRREHAVIMGLLVESSFARARMMRMNEERPGQLMERPLNTCQTRGEPNVGRL